MSEIRIEVFKGSYSNQDVYNRVLGYISKKSYLGGYGFYLGSNLTIIDQFKLSEKYSHYRQPQKIWHFAITFDRNWHLNDLLHLATFVSSFFKYNYQVFYGVDYVGQHPHLHFAVNAFSYNPQVPLLNRQNMLDYTTYIQEKLSNAYYPSTVTLQFQGKAD